MSPYKCSQPAVMHLTPARVGHVIASINEDTGGPAVSVTSLAEELASQGVISHLFALDYAQLGRQIETANVVLHSYRATLITKHIRGLQRQLNRSLHHHAGCDLDLIHNHGLWMAPNFYARQAAAKRNLPLIISPRGMLESWSLKRSRGRKWLAWHLYERENLFQAKLFHATSEAEAAAIRALGFRQPIALIPNGVRLPVTERQPDRAVLTEVFPELADKRWLLFLSRLHPIKGLDNLIQVWKKPASQFSDWQLVIAGPDVTGYKATLERLAEDLGIRDRITFTGMLIEDHKACALAHADLFVLPTHTENFGLAVAEALSYGVPAIVTKGAPWADLLLYKCGWWIEDDEEELTLALDLGMRMSRREREEMGENGRRLMASKYSWGRAAQEMKAVYEWILGRGERPVCVIQ